MAGGKVHARIHNVTLSVFFLVVAHLPSNGFAATLDTPTCSYLDVQRAISNAQEGDTVRIAAGRCTWTSQLNVTKGITIAGRGVDVTILVDSVNKSTAGSNRLFLIDVAAPKRFRLTSLTIEGQAADTDRYNQGHVYITGTSKAFRIDHVKFTNMQTVGIRTDGDLWGVIDNCTFSGNFRQGVFVAHSRWGGHSYGDGSWAAPLGLGSEQAIFIENNEFIELSANYAAGALDALDGARVVFRHNQLRGQFVATHGTESGQRRRSIRSFEFYNNRFDMPSSKMLDRAFFVRGGTGVIWGNVLTGAWNSMVSMQNFRDAASYTPWGKCDGTSAYDGNTSGGYPCVDQPGRGTSKLLSGSTPALGPVGNISDPIYIWSNSGGTFTYGTAGGSANVKLNRDYFVGSPRPGYTPYPYPHPLTSDSNFSGPTAPTNSPAIPTNVRLTP
jgi:hypothetical protein